LLTWADFESQRENGSFRRVQGRWPGSVALEFVEKGDFAPMNLATEARQFTMLAWVRLDRLPVAMQLPASAPPRLAVQPLPSHADR
jgi:hypothetical protein